MRTFIALAALLPVILAASCSAPTYNALPGFAGSNGCVPGGYFQAQDLGNTNPTDLQTRCEAQCVSFGASCEAYVGSLWKAADSNLYTGQCFYYQSASVPTSPQTCADHPTDLVAERKDHTYACLTDSASVATPFCSSYLGIGTVTVYTSTSTPKITATSTTVTTRRTTTTTTTTTVGTETSTISTSLTLTTSTTTSTSTTITPTVTTTATSIITSSTTTITQTTAVSSAAKRAVAPAPSCLASPSVPAARISSACSCLSITSTTVFLVSTAPTATVRGLTVSTTVTTSLSTSTSKSSTTTLTTTTSLTSTTSTLTSITTSTSFKTSTTTTQTTTVSVSTKVVTCSPSAQIVQNGDFSPGGSSLSVPLWNNRKVKTLNYCDVTNYSGPCAYFVGNNQASGALSQVLDICVGASYTFSAYIGFYDSGTGAPQLTDWTVTIGSQTIVATEKTCSAAKPCTLRQGGNNMAYRLVTVPFTATEREPLLTFTFQGENAGGMQIFDTVLDRVTVTQN